MRQQSFVIEDLGAQSGTEILQKIERAGRTCYKSEDRITEESATRFVQSLIRSGHHSVIEHHNVTARIVTNRGVTHELVRHRLASYSQESTRYCDYSSGGIEFIWPAEWTGDPISEISQDFINFLGETEKFYKRLRSWGWTPQQAREVLPNALKTEIVVTANLREWRHIFDLRCSKAAHPQIRELMLQGLRIMSNQIPIVFEDLVQKYLIEGGAR